MGLLISIRLDSGVFGGVLDVLGFGVALRESTLLDLDAAAVLRAVMPDHKEIFL